MFICEQIADSDHPPLSCWKCDAIFWNDVLSLGSPEPFRGVEMGFEESREIRTQSTQHPLPTRDLPPVAICSDFEKIAGAYLQRQCQSAHTVLISAKSFEG